MLSKLYSFGVVGIDGFLVIVETHISGGLPSFDVVGLGDNAVKEARERVRSALKNNQFGCPNSKITVNLAPADVKKTGAFYDMPIMLGILAATGAIAQVPDDYAFAGEISLDGQIRGINGGLSMAICAKENGFKKVFLPMENANEASVIDGIEIYGIVNILQLVEYLRGNTSLTPHKYIPYDTDIEILDFKDVQGQQEAKRAIEIAVAGMHNIVLSGPPGSGKSMLAKRMPSIMPPMTIQQAIETTKIYSVAGLLAQNSGLITQRPFRNPHHSVSSAALTGGGRLSKPGEISLAHNGILFLDEIAEFHRDVLEALRAPLEDNAVTISRINYTQTYPSNIMLVGAMNPCPCGYYGDTTHKCSCTQARLEAYKNKLSGPLMDRIDIHINVAGVNYDELTQTKQMESSKEIFQRVLNARQMQEKRFVNTNITANANITPKYMKRFCKTTKGAELILKRAFEGMGLSARSYDKILKVARTIADLAGSEIIDTIHMLEAVQYRNLDRKY